MRNLALVFIALAMGCYTPVAEDSIASSVTVLGMDGDPCMKDSDCAPTGKECVTATCVVGVCGWAFVHEGAPCLSGVGTCTSGHTCKEPVGVCKKWEKRDYLAISCAANADCDDGNVCTSEACDGGWCYYAPIADGTWCGYTLTCDRGACCVTQ